MENLTCGFIGLGLIGGSMAKALKNGMNAYLRKPVDEKELFDTINNYLI